MSTDTEARKGTSRVLGENTARKTNTCATGCSLKVHESTSREPVDPIHEVVIDEPTTADQKPLADNTQPGSKPESPAVKNGRKTPKPGNSPKFSTNLPRHKANRKHITLENDNAWVTKQRSKKDMQHVSKNATFRTRSNTPSNTHNLGMTHRMDSQNIWSTKRDTSRYYISENSHPNSRTIYVNSHQHNGYRPTRNHPRHTRNVSQYKYDYERPTGYNYQGSLTTGYPRPVNYNADSKKSYMSPINGRGYPLTAAKSHNTQQDYFRLQQTIAPLSAQFISRSHRT